MDLKSEKQFVYARIVPKQDGNPSSKCFNFAKTKDKQQVYLLALIIYMKLLM